MSNERFYHVVVKNIKTGVKVYMTKNPVSHSQGCTLLSKLTKYKWRLEMLEEVIE
jgi:hypothetical protein